MADNNIPVHVCIIPDGNRRWAKEKGLNPSQGHKEAGKYGHIKSLLDKAREIGIKYLTFWIFSTENWQRGEEEKNELFNLLSSFFKKYRAEAIKNKIRIRWLGRRDRMPKDLKKQIEEMEKETSSNKDCNLQLCLDYGGRDELLRTINKILESNTKKVDENDLPKFLDTKEIPDPDLIIRTSGEKRTSGFMPWQSAYSEWHFTDIKFPDFKPENLQEAIDYFSSRKRRFGK